MNDTLHGKLDEILRLLKGDQKEIDECSFCGRRHKEDDLRFNCKKYEETSIR